MLPPPDPAKSGPVVTDRRVVGARKPQTPDTVLLAEIERAERRTPPTAALRREPELPDHVAIAKETTDPRPAEEFAIVLDDEPDDAASQARILRQQMRSIARQVSLDPDDGMEL